MLFMKVCENTMGPNVQFNPLVMILKTGMAVRQLASQFSEHGFDSSYLMV